jgi:hypothetical protein
VKRIRNTVLILLHFMSQNCNIVGNVEYANWLTASAVVMVALMLIGVVWGAMRIDESGWVGADTDPGLRMRPT